jgi:hypothetical protein
LGTVLIMLEDLDLGGTAARTATFASAADVTAAATASEMTADQAAFVNTIWEQIPAPSVVRIGNVDDAGAETYADAYAAVKAETSDFFYVTAQTRTTAQILSLAGALASDFCIYIAQTADAAALGNTATVQAVFTNTTQENFVLVYHPTSTELTGEALDVAYAAARGTFSPDVKSAGWQGVVRGVAAYPDGSVSSSQLGAVKTAGLVNLMLGVEGTNATGYVSPGHTYTGRQIKTMVSVFWYVIRTTEELIAEKLKRDAAGDLIPVDDDGQAIVRTVLEGKYDFGSSTGVGHFKKGQQVLTFPDPITSADVAAGIIRTQDHRITTINNAEEFLLSTAFTRDDVVVTVTEA